MAESTLCRPSKKRISIFLFVRVIFSLNHEKLLQIGGDFVFMQRDEESTENRIFCSCAQCEAHIRLLFTLHCQQSNKRIE